jgi:hypothetical protein
VSVSSDLLVGDGYETRVWSKTLTWYVFILSQLCFLFAASSQPSGTFSILKNYS